jgi:hypothetical protein
MLCVPSVAVDEEYTAQDNEALFARVLGNVLLEIPITSEITHKNL